MCSYLPLVFVIPHCVQWMAAIGNLSNPEGSSLTVATKASPQKAGSSEGGKKVVEEREKIKMWISREISSKKQSKGTPRQLLEFSSSIQL